MKGLAFRSLKWIDLEIHSSGTFTDPNGIYYYESDLLAIKDYKFDWMYCNRCCKCIPKNKIDYHLTKECEDQCSSCPRRAWHTEQCAYAETRADAIEADKCLRQCTMDNLSEYIPWLVRNEGIFTTIPTVYGLMKSKYWRKSPHNFDYLATGYGLRACTKNGLVYAIRDSCGNYLWYSNTKQQVYYRNSSQWRGEYRILDVTYALRDIFEESHGNLIR